MIYNPFVKCEFCDKKLKKEDAILANNPNNKLDNRELYFCLDHKIVINEIIYGLKVTYIPEKQLDNNLEL
jgi:hypothetical protein